MIARQRGAVYGRPGCERWALTLVELLVGLARGYFETI